jgi:hypothetical protein
MFDPTQDDYLQLPGVTDHEMRLLLDWLTVPPVARMIRQSLPALGDMPEIRRTVTTVLGEKFRQWGVPVDLEATRDAMARREGVEGVGRAAPWRARSRRRRGAALAVNRDFVAASLNWILNREKLIGITPKAKHNYRIQLTRRQSEIIFWGTTVVMPAIVLCFGLMVWATRRAAWGCCWPSARQPSESLPMVRPFRSPSFIQKLSIDTDSASAERMYRADSGDSNERYKDARKSLDSILATESAMKSPASSLNAVKHSESKSMLVSKKLPEGGVHAAQSKRLTY